MQFNQSSPVQPVSESMGRGGSPQPDREEGRRTEILVSNIGYLPINSGTENSQIYKNVKILKPSINLSSGYKILLCKLCILSCLN